MELVNGGEMFENIKNSGSYTGIIFTLDFINYKL